ncbi:MAG: pyridoxamine 5'-phosphate oxidase family protein [Thaumarchaeota archaeon]|nr:pyridoxamine 5'-phosphate oxidase family protein [Nitrososphaerota archaeon]
MPAKKILTGNQRKFLESHELCSFAVSESDGMPHVTPVIYAMDGDCPVVATDYGTKKLKILKENKKVALLVEESRPNKVVMIQGECEIYERGKEYLRLLKILMKKFKVYRENPWGEGESPILRITPRKAVSWGT